MNSFVSLSNTGSTVNELSVIRCNASSTDSLELAWGEFGVARCQGQGSPDTSVD